jgi:1,2-diacylglycerol 3-beta-galactosyltransferase
VIAAPSAPPAAAPVAGRRRPLLFLFADTGGGHRAGAAAVARQVESRHGDAFRVDLLDPFAEVSPRALALFVELYSPLIRRAPWAWGTLWHATDSRLAARAMRVALLRFAEPGLRAVVDGLDPAAVVSFHPLLNDAAAHMLRSRPGERIPLVTVITDLVDVHASWTCPAADAIITASAGGLDHCRRAGIPAERCVDLGLPVDQAFCTAPADTAERSALRRRLGLDEETFTVLLSGGGEGSGGLLRRARALLRSRVPLQVVAVCGRNRRLREQLELLTAEPPLRLVVQGFVSNMADWMRAADVAITKAGPGTIAEALCAGTPLLLTSYVPGQERGNVGYVVDTGTGRFVPRVRDMVDTIEELAQPGSPELAAMRAELGHAARPQAAARIDDLVCELAAAGVRR